MNYTEGPCLLLLRVTLAGQRAEYLSGSMKKQEKVGCSKGEKLLHWLWICSTNGFGQE